MIINYPTGFYRTILPQKPEDRGNITFTISNNTPPRSDLIFPKIPIGIVKQSKELESISLVDRRQAVGELIFTISSAKRTVVGSNSRQYEIGQVLEFENVQSQTIEPMLVGDVTEIRHDTNQLDYASMGLSESDQAVIAKTVLASQTNFTIQLNELKKLRTDAEETINVQQKVVNETTRTINALTISISDPDVQALVIKLTIRRDSAISARDVAITNANEYAVQADAVLAQLRTISVVVK